MFETSSSPYRTTVSVVAAAKDLTVKATVKTEMGISGSASDDLIDTLIHQASAAIVSYLGREVASETLVNYFRPHIDVDCLRLSRWPVTSITTITEDAVVVSSAQYETDAATGKVWRLNSSGDRSTWPRDVPIVATFIAGWTLLANEPHDIERCCIDLVKGWFYGRRRDPNVRSKAVPDVYQESYQIGGNMVDAPGGIPGDIAGRLDSYRLARVA